MAFDVLVSADWLQEHLDDPDVAIIDARFAFDHDGYDDYVESHIPGALYLNWSKELSVTRDGVENMLASPDHVEAALCRYGINDDTTIVTYDQEGGHYGSRIWLVLEAYGRGDQVKILDGGWTKWLQDGRPTTADATAEPAPGSITLDAETFRPEFLVDWQEVRDAIGTETVLLDVRRMSEFTGEEVRAKHGGRIPGATWLFWQDNLDWDNDRSFKSPEVVKARAEAVGVTANSDIITYCQGAVRAAHAAIALKMAGFENVRVYDGSWAEWGNRDDVEIAAGPQE